MKLTDLKLLVDCAHADSDGVLVGPGFSAAMKRLLRRKLIEENPNWLGLVRITTAGQRLVDRLLKDAEETDVSRLLLPTTKKGTIR